MTIHKKGNFCTEWIQFQLFQNSTEKLFLLILSKIYFFALKITHQAMSTEKIFLLQTSTQHEWKSKSESDSKIVKRKYARNFPLVRAELFACICCCRYTNFPSNFLFHCNTLALEFSNWESFFAHIERKSQ